MKVRGATTGTPFAARLTALCWGALTLLAPVAISACTSSSSTTTPTIISPTVTNTPTGTGTASANVIIGNIGNNLLAGLGGAETLTGGAGIDTASYADSAAGVDVSLVTGLGHGGDDAGLATPRVHPDVRNLCEATGW